MALREITCTCESCKHTFSAVPTRTFLGFQKLQCPSCSAITKHPLTKGYRITYFVVLAWMLVAAAGAVASNAAPYPGGIGIAVIVALVIDFKYRRKTALLK